MKTNFGNKAIFTETLKVTLKIAPTRIRTEDRSITSAAPYQLGHRSSGWLESNQRQMDLQSTALPTELHPVYTGRVSNP